MRPNVADVFGSGLGVLFEELTEKISQLGAPIFIQIGFAIFNLVKKLVPVFGVEGRESVDQLIDERPEAPPVDRLSMPLLPDDLRGKVLGCSANRKGVVVPSDVVLGEPEVGELDVAVDPDQHVLGFEAA